MTLDEAKRILFERPGEPWAAADVDRLVTEMERMQLLIDAQQAALAISEQPIIYTTGSTSTPDWLKNCQVLYSVRPEVQTAIERSIAEHADVWQALADAPRIPGLSAGMAQMSDDFNAPII